MNKASQAKKWHEGDGGGSRRLKYDDAIWRWLFEIVPQRGGGGGNEINHTQLFAEMDLDNKSGWVWKLWSGLENIVGARKYDPLSWKSTSIWWLRCCKFTYGLGAKSWFSRLIFSSGDHIFESWNFFSSKSSVKQPHWSQLSNAPEFMT